MLWKPLLSWWFCQPINCIYGWGLWGLQESDTTERLSTHIHGRSQLRAEMNQMIQPRKHRSSLDGKSSETSSSSGAHEAQVICYSSLKYSPSQQNGVQKTEAHTYGCPCVLSHFSCVQLHATLQTGAHQTPLSMGFSRREYWNLLPCPPPGDLPDPGVKPASLRSPVLAGGLYHQRHQESTINQVYFNFKKKKPAWNFCKVSLFIKVWFYFGFWCIFLIWTYHRTHFLMLCKLLSSD